MATAPVAPTAPVATNHRTHCPRSYSKNLRARSCLYPSAHAPCAKMSATRPPQPTPQERRRLRRATPASFVVLPRSHLPRAYHQRPTALSPCPSAASANPPANPQRSGSAASGSSPAPYLKFLPASPAHAGSAAPPPSASDSESHRSPLPKCRRETAAFPSPSRKAPRRTKTNPFAHRVLPRALAPATYTQTFRPRFPAASTPPTRSTSLSPSLQSSRLRSQLPGSISPDQNPAPSHRRAR